VDARVTENAPTPEPTSPVVADPSPRLRRFALSPLNLRRWENFKRNRRGYWALWLFLVLFFVSLFAEFIANDKPFLILVNGRPYFPVVVTYPETTVRRRFRNRCGLPRSVSCRT
jgi:ABC-type uncharacterized transport system, permease component